ncbi:hypothetical protein Hanom_Chr06g00481091 [Helianthus anomalus]
MQEEREVGGGHEEYVGLHGDLNSHDNLTHEVGNNKVDKGDTNGTDSHEWGQNIGAGRFNSGGPNQGFNVGKVDFKRNGFKKPRILAQPRKEKGQCSSSPVLRPFKRSRHQMDEDFSFSHQFPATAPVEAFQQDLCLKL